ncbi:uncharacterized protein LOC101240509 isoform X1 [Hydra vulgaris]|uniref:uncharacterized protein LOC101240509 isoform X1 n=1 Tax=Hydra vulgaris TaxID=6087 RepID=UPI0002B4A227|nr:ras-like protein 1 isoform X1 [Hydra vulgaris]
MKKTERRNRSLRAKTFSGISSDTLQQVGEMGVAEAEDRTFSSDGDMSSPETTPEPDNRDKKESKNLKKVKKHRQQRVTKGDDQFKDTKTVFNPSTILVAPTVSSQKPNTMLGAPLLAPQKLEKSSSFKKKERLPSTDVKSNKENLEEKKETGHKRTLSRTIPTPDKITECNIVLLGDLGVGKTALAVRFVTRRYLHEYDPKLERFYEKSLEFSGEQVSVKLWDTVIKTWSSYVDQADAYLVMYSVTSENSAINAQNIINSIRSSPSTRNIPIMLGGNKIELENARKVTRKDVENFASSTGCLYKEFSVASTLNVDPIIKSIIKEVASQEGGRTTPSNLSNDPVEKTVLGRKASNTKQNKMKRFLSKKSS